MTEQLDIDRRQILLYTFSDSCTHRQIDLHSTILTHTKTYA